MKVLYDEMLLSILHSATNETGCLAVTEQPPIMPVSSLLGGDTRAPPSAPHRVCEWQDDIGLLGGDLVRSEVMQSREDCARACVAWTDASPGRSCGAADWNGERCFLKEKFAPFPREGGHVCVVRQ